MSGRDLITDDPRRIILVSNGIQEIRENGFGRENIPAMMAAVVVISLPLIVLFLVFRKQDHGRAYREEGQRDEKAAWKNIWRHGSSAQQAVAFAHRLPRREGGRMSFELPDSFDTSKNYEITFWAKNDTNKTQTDIYKKAIADFEALYPNITVNLKLYTDYGKIYNDVITNIATDTTPNVCITYPGSHRDLPHRQGYVVVPLDELLMDDEYGLGGSRSGL